MTIKTDTILLLKGQIRSDIRSIYRSESDGHVRVTFDNGKMFPYRPENVIYLSRDADLPMPVRVTRRADGMVFQKILGVSTFIVPSTKEIRAYRVVFENGDHRDYLEEDILVEKHVKGERAKNVYNYLKDLSKFSHITVDDDISIGLFQKYAKVSMITDKSPLADYLIAGSRKDMRAVLSGGVDIHQPIFPFGCNRSQYKAVKEALENKISVIQGPPGTGKTQTILNIVANLIIAGKSIEIVSNNNSAVVNVAEKLQKKKYGLDWLVAYLGNSANKKAFYSAQSGTYPELESWEREDLPTLKNDIARLSARLQNGYENLERLAILRDMLSQTEIQEHHISEESDGGVESLRKVKRSSEALELMGRINTEMESKGKLGFFTRFKLRRKGIKDPVEGSRALEKTYYQTAISELRAEINAIENDVKSIRQNEEMLEDYSLKYLHGRLYQLFKPMGGARPVFKQQEVERYNPQPFLKEYPIILSTTFSATTNINASFPYDYLIMDEASQVDVSAGALALNCARNAVIVGDDNQLPNVVTTDDKIAADMLFRQYDIPSQYEFTQNSFLSSLCSLFKDMPITMLREHYRCAPAIIGFCNKQFYGGRLIAMTTEGKSPSLKIASTGEGNFARGAVNNRQAEMIARELVPDLVGTYDDIGVIAPYNEQVRAISDALRDNGFDSIPVATVHKFQGRENDVIILSTVDNQIRSFVDDPHLLNVAVSRAKKLFILVVSGNDQPPSNVKDLQDYIAYNNGEVFNTSLRSVFDLLYKQMGERRKEFLSSHRRVSRYNSENLMFALLEDVVKENRFRRYDVLNNYPLRNVVPDDASLSAEEDAFAHRSWSHIDFLLFDRVTHSPVLAVEVDGTSFHFKGSDQSRRDALKDAVLGKIGLPLLRLSTDGSSEKEKIRAHLDSLISR